MIIEFQPNCILLSAPAQYWVYYKEDNDMYFKKMCMSQKTLILFIEHYGYESIQQFRNSACGRGRG